MLQQMLSHIISLSYVYFCFLSLSHSFQFECISLLSLSLSLPAMSPAVWCDRGGTRLQVSGQDWQTDSGLSQRVLPFCVRFRGLHSIPEGGGHYLTVKNEAIVCCILCSETHCVIWWLVCCVCVCVPRCVCVKCCEYVAQCTSQATSARF